MQTTLEVRWFQKGTPSAVVQHWFKSECPGQLLAPEAETREDLYACGDLEEYYHEFSKFVTNLVNHREINLKLRENNLELKLRQKQLGIQTFTVKSDRSFWSGSVEQWCKLDRQQLGNAALSLDLVEADWISVYKKRLQKSDRGVESELTQLKIEGSAWWSIAFEMTRKANDPQAESHFIKAVERAAKTYQGPRLLAADSYSYVDWLDKLVTDPRKD